MANNAVKYATWINANLKDKLTHVKDAAIAPDKNGMLSITLNGSIIEFKPLRNSIQIEITGDKTINNIPPINWSWRSKQSLKSLKNMEAVPLIETIETAAQNEFIAYKDYMDNVFMVELMELINSVVSGSFWDFTLIKKKEEINKALDLEIERGQEAIKDYQKELEEKQQHIETIKEIHKILESLKNA